MTRRNRTFSLVQLDLFAEWGRTPPLGLRFDLAGDHEHLEEVAEIGRHRGPPLYFLTPRSGGAIEVCLGGDGCRDAFRAAMDGEALAADAVVVADLGAALALVERVERGLA